MNTITASLHTDSVKPDVLLLTDSLSAADTEAVIQAPVANASQVRVIIDHDTPSGTPAVAEKQKQLRNFAQKWQIPYIYGNGIAYQLLMEQGGLSGKIVASCGTHAATVGAAGALGLSVTVAEMIVLLSGGTLNRSALPIRNLTLTGQFSVFTSVKDLALTLIQGRTYAGTLLMIYAPQLASGERVTLCNLLAGGSITACITGKQPSSGDTLPLESVQPMAVKPGGFSHIAPAQSADGLRVNQVFIGGCCGGTLEALRTAARLFRGRQASRYVRVMIAPASHAIYLQAMDEGLIDIFLDAHVLIMNSGCSACWAQSQGRCDQNEIFVTTGSINKSHWAGACNNGIYLASVPAAVQAALTGFLYEY